MLKPNVESFIGCDCDYESARMVLYGAPFDSTTSFRPGARFGPSAMRHESFGLETYSPYQDADLTDCAVFDSGDLELCFGSAQAALEAIEARAAEILGAGKLPLLLGGEHLVTLGVVRAAVKRHPELHIIHFDAHADLRDNYLGADDVRQVIDLINAYKPDLVMNIALPCQDLTIMDACLACGVNYMDTANYEPEDTDDPAWRAVYEKRCKEAGFSAYFDYSWQWAYRKRFEEAGLTALLGCGFDPGVTQAYCAHAKKHEFDTINIPDCNGGDHGYAFATNFNPEVNLREVSAPAAGWAPPAPSGTRGMSPELTGLLDGLHFHTLCEQDSDALEITLNAVAEGFGDVLPGMKWLNFGGVWGGKVFSGPMTSGFLSGAAAWGTGLAHRGTGQQKDSSRDDCCPFVMR